MGKSRTSRRILFLCMGNCVRSQMAEAIANFRGGGRFRACSAGAEPAGYVHEGVKQVLKEIHVPTRNLRSKGWEEFGNRRFDAVITLCDRAREILCERWPEPATTATPRLPIRGHWHFPDPIQLDLGTGEEYLEAFRRTRNGIRECVERLVLASPEVLTDDTALADLLEDISELAVHIAQEEE